MVEVDRCDFTCKLLRVTDFILLKAPPVDNRLKLSHATTS